METAQLGGSFRPREFNRASESSSTPVSPLAFRPPDVVNAGGKGPRVIAMAFNVHNAEQMRQVLNENSFFKGSDEQVAIWDEMLSGSRHIMVNACAGGGKTSTAQQGILRLIRDQDASAKSCTFHSLGNSICKKHFPALARTKPNQYKLHDIIDKIERPLTVSEEDWFNVQLAVSHLTKMAKVYLLDGTNRERLAQLADFFGIELSDYPDTVYELVPRVVRSCLEKTSEIDFQDMIFFPAMMNLQGDVYDLLIADECQDASPDQRKLFQIACPSGRIMGIGDHWQALYSWRGADVDAMEQLKNSLEATKRGVVQLPLTMTRRCPSAHVALAQAICGPGVIEAMPDAPKGVTRVIDENTALTILHSGDMVMCRVNRYLIPTAYSLIKRGIKAIVRGREIGDGLAAAD